MVFEVSNLEGLLMHRLIFSLFAFVSLGTALPAAALKANQTVESEKVVIAADGSESFERTAADSIKPGDRVVYSLNVENDGVEDASNIILTMPIPSEVKFIEGSELKDGALVSYSVDGGQTFLDREGLTVLMDDGTSRVAEVKDISHIRWELKSPIAAGSTDVLRFKGVLK